jgi:hypothetical protein
VIASVMGTVPIYIGVILLLMGMTPGHLSGNGRVSVVRFEYLTMIHDLSS